MAYLYNTPDQTEQMLQAIGVRSTAELFEQIPSELRLNRPLDLPPALSELELEGHLASLAAKNRQNPHLVCMMGGGAYDHFIPSAVDAIAGRSEFYTAYTPYQAEASQGSLQAFYEYQSLICQLTGMEVSNASLYEGGTAVSEAIFMAMRVTDRDRKVVMVGSVNPHYRQTVETYLRQINAELVVVPCPEGTVDVAKVVAALDDKTSCLVVQSPNFFGCLEDVKTLAAAAAKVGALSVQSFDPISLGILQRPGDLGVDIAVAEGQALGTPLQYGGPYLGVFACRMNHVRKMPGRLIGESVDRLGRRCFVLNLQAREQHIRRDKATSNICSNQGLIALRGTVYLSLLGPQGLSELANLCCQKAHYAAAKLSKLPGVSMMFDRPFVREFVLRVEEGADAFLRRAATAGFAVGPTFSAVNIGSTDQQRTGVVVAVTEKRTKAEIDTLVAALN